MGVVCGECAFLNNCSSPMRATCIQQAISHFFVNALRIVCTNGPWGCCRAGVRCCLKARDVELRTPIGGGRTGRHLHRVGAVPNGICNDQGGVVCAVGVCRVLVRFFVA